MSFSALDSELNGPLFASEAMRAVFSDRATLAAMIEVEAAIASAEARLGIVPDTLAPAIRRMRPEDFDLAALGATNRNAGVISIPFVKAAEAKLPAGLRGHFHKGATSQDLLDTALALQIRPALALVADDLAAIMAGLTRLARRHRRTPSIGRTFDQHAAPVSFGYEIALWLAGIAEVAAALPRIRERALVASLGGPVGTLAALGSKGPAVARAFARALGLRAPPVPPHVARARMVETATFLAMAIGAAAKMAADVAHLASTEVGEVSEPHVPGRGGSSALPHKRNPVSATVILAAHGAAKGHVTTMIDAMAAGHQRPVGQWKAEWLSLPQLFGLASGALREARILAEGLVTHPDRMKANLEITRGLLFAEAAAARLAPALGRETAHRLVMDATDRVRVTGGPLLDILAADERIPARARGDIAAAFDLAPALDAASAAADRILADTAPILRQTRRLSRKT